MTSSRQRLAAATAAVALLAAASIGTGHAQSLMTGGAGSSVGDSGAGNNSNVMPANPSLQTKGGTPVQNQSNAGVNAAGAADSSATAGSVGAKKMPPSNPAAAATTTTQPANQNMGGEAGATGSAAGGNANGLLRSGSQTAGAHGGGAHSTGDTGGPEATKRQQAGSVGGEDSKDAAGIPLVPQAGQGGGVTN